MGLLRFFWFIRLFAKVLFLFCLITLIILVFFEGKANAYQANQHIVLPLNTRSSLQPTILASTTVTNSTNADGASSSPGDTSSIVSTFVTLAGVVIALAGLVLTFLTIGGAVAGFFGIREFRLTDLTFAALQPTSDGG